MKQKISKSYVTIISGLLSMIIACGIFYFDTRSTIAYSLFGIGFILVGVGILFGFFKMVSEDNNN